MKALLLAAALLSGCTTIYVEDCHERFAKVNVLRNSKTTVLSYQSSYPQEPICIIYHEEEPMSPSLGNVLSGLVGAIGGWILAL